MFRRRPDGERLPDPRPRDGLKPRPPVARPWTSEGSPSPGSAAPPSSPSRCSSSPRGSPRRPSSPSSGSAAWTRRGSTRSSPPTPRPCPSSSWPSSVTPSSPGREACAPGPSSPWRVPSSSFPSRSCSSWSSRRRGSSRGPRGRVAAGSRALGVGSGPAYGSESLRLVAYVSLVGWSPPSGLVWLWDYGPTMLLSLLAIYFWLDLSFLRSRSTADRGISLGFPLAGAVLGLAASQGLGGVLLSYPTTRGRS